MDRGKIESTIKELFQELDAAEKQAHDALLRADGLKRAIAGLESLLPPAILDLPEPEPKPASRWHLTNPRTNGKVPGTTEAILTILNESEKSVSVEEIRKEFDRRGWTNRDSKAPEKLIYETLRRLSAQSPPRIRRVRRGRYMAVKKPGAKSS